MQKRLQKLMTVFMAFAIILTAFCFNVSPADAASATVTISGSSSGTVGDTITVTVKYSGITYGAADSALVFDSSMLQYVSATNKYGQVGTEKGMVRVGMSSASDVSSLSYSVKFKLLKAGSAKVTVETSSVSDSGSGGIFKEYHVSDKSKTITIKNPAASTNCSLGSLVVSPGELEPEFSSEVLNYVVNVGNEETEFVVSAKAANANATTKVSGSSKLEVGANTRSITVTAQSGDTRVYKITINRADENGLLPDGTNYEELQKEKALNITVDSVDYKVSDVIETVPEGFTKDTIKFNGIDLQVLKAADSEIVLGLVNSVEGEGEYLVFGDDEYLFLNQETGKFEKEYSLTSAELMAYAKALANGTTVEPTPGGNTDVDPKPTPTPQTTNPIKKWVESLGFGEDVFYIIAAALAGLLLIVIILEIGILAKRGPKQKKSKHAKEE